MSAEIERIVELFENGYTAIKHSYYILTDPTKQSPRIITLTKDNDTIEIVFKPTDVPELKKYLAKYKQKLSV